MRAGPRPLSRGRGLGEGVSSLRLLSSRARNRVPRAGICCLQGGRPRLCAVAPAGVTAVFSGVSNTIGTSGKAVGIPGCRPHAVRCRGREGWETAVSQARGLYGQAGARPSRHLPKRNAEALLPARHAISHGIRRDRADRRVFSVTLAKHQAPVSTNPCRAPPAAMRPEANGTAATGIRRSVRPPAFTPVVATPDVTSGIIRFAAPSDAGLGRRESGRGDGRRSGPHPFIPGSARSHEPDGMKVYASMSACRQPREGAEPGRIRNAPLPPNSRITDFRGNLSLSKSDGAPYPCTRVRKGLP